MSQKYTLHRPAWDNRGVVQSVREPEIPKKCSVHKPALNAFLSMSQHIRDGLQHPQGFSLLRLAPLFLL